MQEVSSESTRPERRLGSIELAPEHSDALFYLGLALTRIGEYSDAISALERTLQLDPSKQYVYHHIGLAYFHNGQHDIALENFEQALLFDPQKSETHFYLLPIETVSGGFTLFRSGY